MEISSLEWIKLDFYWVGSRTIFGRRINWKLLLGFQLKVKKSYLYLIDHSIVVIFAWLVELEKKWLMKQPMGVILLL